MNGDVLVIFLTGVHPSFVYIIYIKRLMPKITLFLGKENFVLKYILNVKTPIRNTVFKKE